MFEVKTVRNLRIPVMRIDVTETCTGDSVIFGVTATPEPQQYYEIPLITFVVPTPQEPSDE